MDVDGVVDYVFVYLLADLHSWICADSACGRQAAWKEKVKKIIIIGCLDSCNMATYSY